VPEEHEGLVRNQESAPSVCSSAEEFWSSKPAVGGSNPSGPANKDLRMYEVNYKNEDGIDCREEFVNLDLAIKRSKMIGSFVTISFAGNELVGRFGVDSVECGQLPNGDNYTWKKRR